MFYLIRQGAFAVCFAILRHDVSFAAAGLSRHLAFPLTWTDLACRAERAGVLTIWLACVHR